MRLSIKISGFIIAIFAVASVSTSCNRAPNSNTNNSESSASSSPAASPKAGFDADLEYVRKGQYTYIWVFSRKDGKPIDKEDADYLRKNAPQVVDWVATEEGKKVIAGTNFDLKLGNMELLRKRFVVEDYTGR